MEHSECSTVMPQTGDYDGGDEPVKGASAVGGFPGKTRESRLRYRALRQGQEAYLSSKQSLSVQALGFCYFRSYEGHRICSPDRE